jgi:soluble lytic murein transglycosylase-like protein
LIAHYARIHGIPVSLVRRVVAKESGYEPAAFNHRFYGLMQVTYRTARSMGYRGGPEGLFDPEVNLTYGVPYLADAYRLADGRHGPLDSTAQAILTLPRARSCFPHCAPRSLRRWRRRR